MKKMMLTLIVAMSAILGMGLLSSCQSKNSADLVGDHGVGSCDHFTR
jgi:hypothetical protein